MIGHIFSFIKMLFMQAFLYKFFFWFALIWFGLRIIN